jgi:hypothetical protein
MKGYSTIFTTYITINLRLKIFHNRSPKIYAKKVIHPTIRTKFFGSVPKEL